MKLLPTKPEEPKFLPVREADKFALVALDRNTSDGKQLDRVTTEFMKQNTFGQRWRRAPRLDAYFDRESDFVLWDTLVAGEMSEHGKWLANADLAPIESTA